MDRIRIAAFDQMPLCRAGIVHILNTEAGMKVVAEGNSIAEALRAITQRSADVVIIDANLIQGDLTAARSIVSLCSAAKVILLAFFADEETARSAFNAGVLGYVLKTVGRHELVEAVRSVHRGEGYVSPALAAEMIRNQAGRAKIGRDANGSASAQLTHREEQIFKLLSAGLKNKEIGARLDLSEKSIKRYVTSIFEKLNVRNQVEAAMLSRAGSKPDLPAPTSGRLSTAHPRSEITQTSHSPAFVAADSLITLVATSEATGSERTIRLGLSIARCFYAAFGRSRLAIGNVLTEADAPLGTHILLRT